MAKKIDYRKAQQEATAQTTAPKSAPIAVAKKASSIKWLFFVFGFLLYANTVSYEYVLDDKISIVNNQFTLKGFDGIGDHLTNELFTGFFGVKKNLVSGGRYRPLAHVMFCIEYELFGLNPAIGHFINAVCYGLIGLLLYLILLQLFPPNENKKWYTTFPAIAILLFLVHPLHTEVVANIKSRDELLSLLGALGATWFTLQWVAKKDMLSLALSGVCFFLGLMSKETAIVFIGGIPLMLYFFTKTGFKEWAISLLPIIFVTAIYLVIRGQVVGFDNGEPAKELMNNPFLKATSSQMYATILLTMGIYLKLLFLPHPLTHDYYPKQIPIIDISDWRALLPLAIYLILIVIAILGLRKKSMTSFAIIWYLGTFILFSNLFFPIGTFMNERFMFVPSIGFSMLVAWFVLEKLPQLVSAIKPPVQLALLAFIILGFSFKTISRNKAWESDYTLAITDVETSSNSAKVQMSAGLSLIEKSKEITDKNRKVVILNEAIQHLTKSLELYPNYIQPMHLLGNAYYEGEDYEQAITFYENCLKINPQFAAGVQNLTHVGDLMVSKANYPMAAKSYTALLRYDSTNVAVLGKTAEVYGKYMNDLATSAIYLQKALKFDPNNIENLQRMGVIYAMQGATAQAIQLWERCLQLDAKNASITQNLAIAYGQIGNAQRANELMAKAVELDPSLKR